MPDQPLEPATQADCVEFTKVKVLPTGLIKRSQAALALGVRPKTLCHWASRGYGPQPVKKGGRIYYHWAEVTMFAQGQCKNGE